MTLIKVLLQHSAALLLVKAVRDLNPEAKLLRYRTHSLGFTCDFIDRKQPGRGLEQQLKERVRAILLQEQKLQNFLMTATNGAEFLLHHKETFLSERAARCEGKFVKIVQLDNSYFLSESDEDLSLKEIQSVLLFEIEERGEEGRKFVFRVCGAGFSSKKNAKAFAKKYDKYKKNTPANLGKKEKLFRIVEKVNPNLPCFYSKGTKEIAVIQHNIEKVLNEQKFETVSTPVVIEKRLAEAALASEFLSGLHRIGTTDYCLRPSTVPAHVLLLCQRLGKRRLPFKLAEWGKVFRLYPKNEYIEVLNSGEELVDTQTIFCTEEMVASELISSLQSIIQIIKLYGIPFRWILCSQLAGNRKHRKNKGCNAELWDQAVVFLRKALEHLECKFEEVECLKNGGPRVEARFEDCIEREWTGSFIEINLTLPHLLQLNVGKGEMSEIPVIIHRSLVGPVERLISLKLEKASH